ncbi:MAG: ribosome silencing factor [Candidatus Eremiobacteraeota bacterium]|nr:ribosome silencing factor [Candidatus Eremiobacteraeota bacterium]
MDSLQIAQTAADTAVDKRASDVLILDVGKISVLCDYFVVSSAPTRVQTRDIARSIEDALNKKGHQKRRIQGLEEGAWILIDYGDVVIHVFLQQEREFYDLEGLWKEAPVAFDSKAVGLTS